MDADALDLFTTTVVMTPPGTLDKFSQTATEGTPVTAKCHVKIATVYRTTAGNRAKFADGTVWLDDVYPVEELWAIVFPDGEVNMDKLNISSVETTFDQNGPYQTVVYLAGR